jgi:TniQ
MRFRADMRYAYPANGLGKSSDVLLRSFETATGRSDLHVLTLSALQGPISQPNIFRTTEAWCPACLEQWRTTQLTVYSPLLWAMRVVKMCPAHTTPLVDRCPHCHTRFAPLRANARPGYCSICSRWLGTLELLIREDSSPERAYNLWTSTWVGKSSQ